MTEVDLEQLAIGWYPDAGRDSIAQELMKDLQDRAMVDWQQRDSVRARLKGFGRITPRRHRYPPDLHETVIRLVMDQAEHMANDWN